MYVPLNIRDHHWVLGMIDLRERKVIFYDSNPKPTNRDAFSALWIMLPYMLKQYGFFKQRPDIPSTMNPFAHSYAERTPKQDNGYVVVYLNFKYIKYVMS